MKILKSILLFALVLVSNLQAQAQQSNKLILRTGESDLSPNLEEFIQYNNQNTSLYKLMFFNEIPNKLTKLALEGNEVEFLEYIPNKAYIVKFNALSNLNFLRNKNISGVYDLPTNLKKDYRIINGNIPSHAIAENNMVKVAVIAMKNLDIKDYALELQQNNIIPNEYGRDSRFAYCTLSKAQINNLTQKDWVRSIECIDEPGQPESTEGRTLQKSNVINNYLPNGLSYDASGLKLLVRDDGLVGPHIDYEGRLINLTTDATGTHGDGVAGVMGGAGNIDPSVEGGASGADIYVKNYVANFQDTTLDLHLNANVLITNSSYSNGCNAGYTSTTQTVDKQVFDHPTLMHVFSAGNSNNNDCSYGAGDQWGNITGGHKMGKNVIAVANLFNNGTLVNSSSRGPAHDGRIKPDMAAHGQGQMSTDPDHQYAAFGGTSSAAPSLAGNLAQLIEAYRDLNGNVDPKSSLIKAAAMNSATDLGNPGPDFKFGYGLINTARAYDVLANNQYLFSTISQSDSNTHTVSVPAGTGQLRIMLYWHDPEGTVNTNLALVNDLDMVVNNTLLPLVLDHTPNAVSLDSDAVPGIDHLNNLEQVVIDSPAAGSYTVKVKGFQIPSGPQEYVLVYSFIQDEIKVTYPLGGESLIPGNGELIHWDAYGNHGNFTIDYSTDNGTSWTNIGTIAGNNRQIAWPVPTVNTADAIVRVSRGAQMDVSDAPFNIYPVPDFTIQANSSSSLRMDWPAIAGATKYYIWELGPKYMEIIDSTTTNQYIMNGLMSGDNLWLSASANNATITGERAIAQNFVFNPFASCDGCLSSIDSYPHIESFENGLGLFCQATNDDINFTLNSGATSTSGTGPSGASNGNQYIYVEASYSNHPQKQAMLGSPCYDLRNVNGAALTFDYNMDGDGMGSLIIQVSTDGGQTWINAPVWTKSGDQGDPWLTDSVDFSPYIGNDKVSYRFAGTTGSNQRSDIAIDNVIFDIIPYAVSVNDLNKEINYSIQPNPSDGVFYLNTLENLNEIKVINSFGQIIKKINIDESSDKHIDISDQAAGVYFLILNDKNNRVHRYKVSLF